MSFRSSVVINAVLSPLLGGVDFPQLKQFRETSVGGKLAFNHKLKFCKYDDDRLKY